MDRSAHERQKMEREIRKQKRDERQVQLELERRQRQLQSLKESLDREIKEKTKITEQIGLDIDERPGELEGREEDILEQYIESMNALDDDVRDEGEVVEEMIKDKGKGRLELAEILQNDGRNEFDDRLGRYDEDEDVYDYEEPESYLEQFSIKNRDEETDQQVKRVKAEGVKGGLGLTEISRHPTEKPSTPTFLKRVEDSITNAPKSIIKKDSSTPVSSFEKTEMERSEAEDYDGSLGKNVSLNLEKELKPCSCRQR